MAGCLYRPRREVDIKTLIQTAEDGRKATGLNKIALIGAAVSDHSQFEFLCSELINMGFIVTTPSLRIESVNEDLLEILKSSGLKTITIAPESTWKLRSVANKPITDDQIKTAMDTAFKLNMNDKLYFLTGLPTETDEDLQEMMNLIRSLQLMAPHQDSLRISINPFIPKPHTPFQWVEFDHGKIKANINFLKRNLKSRHFKVENPNKSLIQYVLSMGDANLGDIIEESSHRKVPINDWKKLTPHWNLEKKLPWEVIDIGMKKKFLVNEYKKALKGDLTPWCETFGCYTVVSEKKIKIKLVKTRRTVSMKPAERVKSIDLSGIRKMFDMVGENSINLALGEPDFDTPPHIREAVKEALDEGFTHYTGNMGIIELREALSHKLKNENHIETSPESIIVTTGASGALYSSTNALIEEGDEVIIPDPGFVAYDACVKISGGKSVPAHLKDENDFRLLPEDLLELVTPRTKAIIMNSPGNPTGGVLEKDDIKGLADIADDHNIILISDEIYEKIIYGKKHYSPARYSDNVITINGFSKTYAMTGFRIGYLAAPPELVEDILKVHQYTVTCATSLSQKAALAALQGPQDEVREMVSEFKRRRNMVVERLRDMGIKCNLPHGAFYVFPSIENPEKLVEKALEKDVVLVPGNSFGKYGEGISEFLMLPHSMTWRSPWIAWNLLIYKNTVFLSYQSS
jgi:aspartate aminotransferase